MRWLYEKLGLDVACFTLPFHGPRRGVGSAYTGQQFVSEGMSWTAEAFRQTVLDFRALLNYLEHDRGSPAVGVSGISLGGYTTALLASVEPRLAFRDSERARREPAGRHSRMESRLRTDESRDVCCGPLPARTFAIEWQFILRSRSSP